MSNVPRIDEPFFAMTEAGKLLAHNVEDNDSILLDVFDSGSNSDYYVTVENVERQDGLIFLDFVFELRDYPKKRFTAGSLVLTETGYKNSPLPSGSLPSHFAFSVNDSFIQYCAVLLSGKWYALNGFMNKHDFLFTDVAHETL